MTIIETLSIAGAKAGIKNTRLEFNAPIISAARLMNKRKGNIIRVRRTVKENFSGIFKKPGAIAVTIEGANIIPIRQIKPTNIIIKVNVTLTSLFASSLPFLA